MSRSIIKLLEIAENTSPENLEELRRGIENRTVPKGTVLQNPGGTCQKGYFVKKGLLRSYIIDEKGKEHIFMFAPEGWIISDIESQANDSPAQLYIDAIEDTELEALDRRLLNATSKLPVEAARNEIKRLFRRIGTLQKRVILLMSAPARGRYEDFLHTYPDIVQRVPQKMIASYLGITPEALSKIRGSIARSE